MNLIIVRTHFGRTSVRELIPYLTSEFTIATPENWPSAHFDTVFRWGCTASIPWQLYRPDVINPAGAIHLVNDKAVFRRICQEHQKGLVPETYQLPFPIEAEEFNYPVIVRSRNHFQGRGLWFCYNHIDMWGAVDQAGRDCYISEYIPKIAEFRVFIVQGRVAFVSEKVPDDPTAVAWNHANGSSFVNVRWDDWPTDVIEKSLTAFSLSGLDFGAVDVIMTERGIAYVLEINTAPALESSYRVSCIAKCFDYIIEHGHNSIPIDPLATSWRKWIHPSVNRNAVIGADPI